MFENITPAPPDAILGLSEAFKKDPRDGKINLAVGVYKDAEGRTPVLEAVKAAERRLVDTETSKSYLPIDGSPAYARQVQALLFGRDHGIVEDNRAGTAQTPGGTGGLRVAGDYLHQNHPSAAVWLSDPTWANHDSIFEAAGLTTRTYPYLDRETNTLDLDAMLEALRDAPAGDVVLLHGCCHNPTGVDPTAEQWERVAAVLAERGLLPLVDFAYQGFGDGLEEDAAGLRAVAAACDELLVCSSFSKNFGLYNERVGALTVVAKDEEQAEAVMTRVRRSIRANYSNPPAHGGSVVATILDDDALRQQWRDELTVMRQRINTMRERFADALDDRGVSLSPEGNDFVRRQRGMFTMSGLSKAHVEKLRDDHAIYIVGSGRINVAGMNDDNIPTLCDAIADVMQARRHEGTEARSANT